MISQKHADDLQQGEQSVSAVEEKQATTVSKGRSRHTSASPRQWIVVLFCILGIAMPLIAGWMVFEPRGVGDIFNSEWVYLQIYIAPVVSVAFGAFLLGFASRRWWPGLLVAVAWIVGEYLAALVVDDWGGNFWEVESWAIIIALVLLTPLGVSGALVGNAFRQRWEMQRQTTLRTDRKLNMHEQGFS